MGILNAYDGKGTPVITPDKIYKDKIMQADTCIVTFSHSVLEKVIEEYEYEIAGYAGTANGPITIYHLVKEDVLLFMTPVGAPAAGTLLQEVRFLTGADHFIYFGSCGLIDEKAKDKVIIPTSAYREEGFSYHYAPPSDYIEFRNYAFIENILKARRIPCITGKTWTTDAIYMETDAKIRKRKEDGCLCVEMESSGLQAVCSYLGVELYIFFFTGDIVSEEWDRADLGGRRERRKQLSCFDTALLIAGQIKKT